MKLWDANHPYYCSESNYYVDGYSNFGRADFESWTDFYEEFGTSDHDMNLVFRWDWKQPDPNDYDEEDPMPDHDTLWIFMMLQRKGIFRPCQIAVTKDDEEAARTWLAGRWETLHSMWSPITA